MRTRIAAIVVAVVLIVSASSSTSTAQPSDPWAYPPCGGLVHDWRVFMSLPPIFDHIAYRESRCRAGAVSPGGDRGVWQIAPGTRRWCARLLGPGFDVHHVGWNALCAHELFVRYGLKPWATS